MPQRQRFALSVLALACCSAWAEPATEEDELALAYGGVVSIATGGAIALRRAPAVATVITAADIAAMGATDLDQVLEGVPGMHVERSANVYSPLYIMRGVFSQFAPQLLVLQNGIPITTLYQSNKGNLWGGYPLEHIARIEVIRGPGSALYGSDAYSGVVNIITKTAQDTPGLQLGARAGAFHSRDAWLQYGGHGEQLDVQAYVRAGHTGGLRSIVAADAQTRNDTLFGTHASLAPGPVNTGGDAIDANVDLAWGKWRLRGGYKLRRNLGSGAGVASALDPVGKMRSERITTDLSWTDQQFARDWSGGAMLSSLHYTQLTPQDLQLLPPGLRFPTGLFADGMIGGPDTSERTLRLSGYVGYSGLAGQQLRLGAGHDDLDLYYTHETRNFNYSPSGLPIPLPGVVDTSNTTPFLRPHRRKIDYFYAQDEWGFARDWMLTAGVRHDRYSDAGATTNPRMALVWDARFDLTAKLMYGRAFRAPAFIEEYGTYNPVAIGNPALRPETSATLEAALVWQAAADLRANLNLYRTSSGNIIRTMPNALAGTGSTYANTGSQTGHGLEAEWQWNAAAGLRVLGSFAWQRTVDDASGHDAGYAPHQHLNVRTEWDFVSGWSASAQANQVAGRQRAQGDARKPIANYTSVDLTVGTTPRQHGWNLAVALRNAFNADMREPSVAPGLALPFDLPMAPRALTVSVAYQW
ncbi:MAG: TonB-dependent receptor [Pseudomonadota bacterium]